MGQHRRRTYFHNPIGQEQFFELGNTVDNGISNQLADRVRDCLIH